MAPRGRPRGRPRSKNSRMDAAIETMAAFGFSEKLVRDEVNRLLDLFDGSWGPIEEGGYCATLLECLLLRKKESETEETDNAQESIPEGENLLQLALEEDNGAGDHAILDIVGPLGVDEPSHSEINTASQTETDNTENPNCPLPAGGVGKGLKDVYCVQSSIDAPRTPVNSPPTVLLSPPLVSSLPQTRKPCYGWLNEDENEPRTFIYLRHAASMLHAKLPENSGRTKRKSRWDVGPDDL